MKEETKENIRWIKSEILKTNKLDKIEKAIKLLDSLEGFEHDLKNGGFIPDRNNKPCGNGDFVTDVNSPNGKLAGTWELVWDQNYQEFRLRAVDKHIEIKCTKYHDFVKL